MTAKRKALAYTLGSLVFISITVLSFKGYKTLSTVQEKYDRIQYLPSISLVQLDETSITISDFIHDKPLLIIYFNSDCPYCEQSFRLLHEHIDQLKGYSIVAISNESLTKIYSFRIEMELELHSEIAFLQDVNNEFHDFYLIKTIPTYLQYSKDGKFTSEHHGSGFIKELTTSLQSEISK
jgi:thioredoxin-related protein